MQVYTLNFNNNNDVKAFCVFMCSFWHDSKNFRSVQEDAGQKKIKN